MDAALLRIRLRTTFLEILANDMRSLGLELTARLDSVGRSRDA